MKKGALSIEVLIIIILAVIVLVIVAAAFSGGMAKLWQQITGISEAYTQSDLNTAKTACQQYCALGDKTAFCTHTFSLVEGKTCRDAPISVSCPAIAC